MEDHWKFLGGGGILKVKFLEAMYQNKLEFPGGRGVQNKKPSVEGVRIFSGTAHFIGKDQSFVIEWLVRQGLDQIVEVFKGMFPRFQAFSHCL